VNRIVARPPVHTDGLRVVASRVDGGAVGITAVQSWRREDERVKVRLQGGDDLVRVRPGQTFELTGSIHVTRPVTTRYELVLPRGWTAKPIGSGDDRSPTSSRLRWRVSVPATVPLGARLPLRLLVRTLERGTEVRATADLLHVEAAFDPADFGTPVWDDDFTGTQLGAYRLSARFGEPAPDLHVADGALIASAAGRQSAAALVAPVAAPGGDFAVLLEPRSFAGAAPEDSVLLGRAAGPDDLVLAWYNNHFHTSGADVRVAGRDHGDDATGGCCANVTWSPGDRLAAVFSGETMTSWLNHQGQWQLLRTVPFGNAVAPDVADWSPAIGLRLTSGQLAIDRMTVLARG
jgi:hypothetical protein